MQSEKKLQTVHDFTLAHELIPCVAEQSCAYELETFMSLSPSVPVLVVAMNTPSPQHFQILSHPHSMMWLIAAVVCPLGAAAGPMCVSARNGRPH